MLVRMETSTGGDNTLSQSRKKRSKSVTFADDTKIDDGNSAKSFGAPASDPPPAVHPQINSSTHGATEDFSIPDVPVPNSKKSKNSKDRKTRSGDKDKRTPGYVEYLQLYFNDRPNWKFNKSKQTDLLKNIWNFFRVPSELDTALVEYIKGLQGEGARQRLQNEATGRVRKANDRVIKILEEAEPSSAKIGMATQEERADAESRAFQLQCQKRGIQVTRETYRELLEEDERQQLAESERAGRLLYEAFTGLATPTTTTATAPIGRRSRKSRTATGPDLSDTSESDDTSSSSEDESSDDESDSSESDSGSSESESVSSDSESESSDSGSESSSGSGSGSDADSDHKIFSDKFLDKYRPKKDYSHLKARAEEIKKQRGKGGVK
ncbi:hypothetical protein CAC42_1809 [Sphaceloma murrayae]|uniref:WKF domain-containing protein n=1 Tax=Sphaceloma murrayae TaxID=2082308 RepID=A0A2K1QW00_9PEZI|nr:hypothetical protein CAC42_1809 [Sphaceloma murrayae]